MIWIPKVELEAFHKFNNELLEEAKKYDWAAKALLQVRIERGDFDDYEPIIKRFLIMIAYSK